eukprot:3081460-Lingulodinium_polyedra.AAC.1
MVLVTKVMLDPMARILCHIVYRFTRPTDQWHQQQNRDNRSPKECFKYYLEEARGRSRESLHQTWKLLEDGH